MKAIKKYICILDFNEDHKHLIVCPSNIPQTIEYQLRITDKILPPRSEAI